MGRTQVGLRGRIPGVDERRQNESAELSWAAGRQGTEGRSQRIMTIRALLLLCLLPSAICARDLQDLVSASNDFEVEMIEHEHVLERNPSASELAASTLKYAKAKERYFVELRKSVPTLIDMATGKAPKTPDLDKIRKIFSGYGEAQEKQFEAVHGFDAKTGRRRSRSLEG